MAKKGDAQNCVGCGKLSAYEIRRDELFGKGAKAVIIENIPLIKCLNCGIVYLEPEVSRMIDDICAYPECHVSIVEKQVAKIA